MDKKSKFWCTEKGHFNLDQANFFGKLIKEVNPQYALETGFCTGRSTFAVLHFAKDLKKMISIDKNFDYRKPEGRQMRELLTSHFPVLTTIEKSSKKVLKHNFLKTNFPNGIDWFTVDGDHGYRGCLRDIVSVHRHMNKGGVIIIDDYKSGPPNGYRMRTVTKACDDFHKTHRNIKREVWNKKGKGFCIFRF